MNRHGGLHDLDDPSDEEVEILHEICKVASTSSKPPFAALFASYEAFFRERGLDTARDPSVFRWLMRVAEDVRPARRNGTPLAFVPQLKSLLRDRGILIVDQDQDRDEDGVTRSFETPGLEPAKVRAPVRRRVSFDDAGLEETWLSEHTKSLHAMPSPARPRLSDQLPFRGRNVASAQLPRARSISSHRNTTKQPATREQINRASPPSSISSDRGQIANPTLLFQPSQTQLEQNAEAFFATSELRMARQCLHTWHDRTLVRATRRVQANDIATAHDRRTLLKQSLDTLVFAIRRQRVEQEREAHLNDILERLLRRKDRWLLAKAFSHWDQCARHQKRVTAVAQRHAMKVKYFMRWHQIAVSNAVKARSILIRKYITRWRNRTARQAIAHERALVHYDASLLKLCFQRLFWTFCSRRVEGWHEQQVERRVLHGWRSQLRIRSMQDELATNMKSQNSMRSAFRKLVDTFKTQQQVQEQAQQHHARTVAADCLHLLSKGAKLAPVAITLSVSVDRNLKQKAIKIWQTHLLLRREAVTVDQKRILQSAWTSWNDALRCKALAQRINERILVESLYKWVLQRRLHSFQQAMETRMLRKSLSIWTESCTHQRSDLDRALATFQEQQRRRLLGLGMLRLYGTFRARENAGRAAVEFANARALPYTVETWRQRTMQVQRLGQWASDARFYSLSTQTLTTWREKTTEHKHNRRRQAYAQIRSRVKYRNVKDCFTRWRARTATVRTLHEEADSRQQARLVETAVHGFDVWREMAARKAQMEMQAVTTDRQKLLGSALSLLREQQTALVELDDAASAFRQESDLALASATLKRVQWATFNAARRTDSAYALLARSRDQHIRQMLRHMAAAAGQRRAAKNPPTAHPPLHDPESPSLRPASRLAARSESRTSRDESTTPLPTPTAAYMRTPVPSSRRLGRFRPLATPSAVTPMAFDPAFFATTPAPLSVVLPAEQAGQSEVFEGLTPQITPFARKLKASGVTPRIPPSALRSSVLGTAGMGRATGGTSKSVRFARFSRFSGGVPREGG